MDSAAVFSAGDGGNVIRADSVLNTKKVIHTMVPTECDSNDLILPRVIAQAPPSLLVGRGGVRLSGKLVGQVDARALRRAA